MLVLLNSGHGMDTLGKRSPMVPPGIVEYAFNRSIVFRIMDKLRNNTEIDAVHINPEYESIPLSERCDRANDIARETKDNVLYVSIHANADGDGRKWINKSHGAAVFVSPFASDRSKQAADIFLDRIIVLGQFQNRGVRVADFFELNHTACPAVLTENGFMTHSAEAAKLSLDYWQNKIAQAHVYALHRYNDLLCSE